MEDGAKSREYANAQEPPGRNGTSTPNAPYSLGGPARPYIMVPVPETRRNPYQDRLLLTPSQEYAPASKLKAEELNVITGNTTQIAKDSSSSWAYEKRWKAQRVMDFLFLGPTPVIKDLAFLRQEGITMVVVIRDPRMITMSLKSVERAQETLGVDVLYLSVGSLSQLIHDMHSIAAKFNSHLLHVYNQQSSSHGGGKRQGRILVTCETGNDRSAAVTAAYIMLMYGKGMIETVQFVGIQRFCCNFDEDIKRMLLTWEDILQAHAHVASHTQFAPPSVNGTISKKSKRSHDNMMDVDAVDQESGEWFVNDGDRFKDREVFVPFIDVE